MTEGINSKKKNGDLAVYFKIIDYIYVKIKMKKKLKIFLKNTRNS